MELLAAENQKLKGGDLVTLKQKVAEDSSCTTREGLNGKINVISSRIDKNHDLYMAKFENLEHIMAQILDCMRNFKSRDSVILHQL